jgi:hypothetical protein
MNEYHLEEACMFLAILPLLLVLVGGWDSKRGRAVAKETGVLLLFELDVVLWCVGVDRGSGV